MYEINLILNRKIVKKEVDFVKVYKKDKNGLWRIGKSVECVSEEIMY